SWPGPATPTSPPPTTTPPPRHWTGSTQPPPAPPPPARRERPPRTPPPPPDAPPAATPRARLDQAATSPAAAGLPELAAWHATARAEHTRQQGRPHPAASAAPAAAWASAARTP